MNELRSNRRACAGLLCGVLAVVLVYTQAGLHAQVEGPSGSGTSWDYQTREVDVSTLQAELVTLGRDRWEVVSILHVDQTVDNQADGRAHLQAGRVLVVAKRPLGK